MPSKKTVAAAAAGKATEGNGGEKTDMERDEISDALSTWREDFHSWALAVFGCEKWPRSVSTELFWEVHGLCKRYGIDGQGDKPVEMSTVTYWLQHIPEDSQVYGRLRLAAKTAQVKTMAEPAPVALPEPVAAPEPETAVERPQDGSEVP